LGGEKALSKETSETNGAGTDNDVRRIELAAQHFLPELGDISRGLSQHMLGLFRDRGKPWPALMHSEQEAIAWAIRDACQDAVRKVYGLVAGLGLPVAPAKCKTITVDDKGATVKLVLDPSFGAVVTGLQGKFVPLTLADMDRFAEIRQELDIAAAQPGLPLTVPAVEAAGNGDLIDPATGEAFEMGDESGAIVPPPPAPGDIQQLALPPTSDRESRRKAAEADPYEAGKADGLQGFSETRNPFEPDTEGWRRYLVGWVDGDRERVQRNENRETGRRRRRRGSDGADTETAA
jgi:hypothetical protein